MAQFTGTAGDDAVRGVLFEANTFSGFGAGADTVVGGIFSDTFFLTADEKADTINGGGGADTVDYSGADRGLTIDLAAGQVFGVFGPVKHAALVANLNSIENATGTSFDDTITGTSGDNALLGGGGSDRIEGGAGADYIDGGTGTNTVSYLHSSSGVWVDLRTPDDQHFGDAEGDQLYNISNVVGSNFHDILTGNGAANTFTHTGGGDGINGLGGTDTYQVGQLAGTAGVAVTLDGSNATVDFADGTQDELVSIEIIRGSQNSDTFAIPLDSATANVFINGLGGDDIIGGERAAGSGLIRIGASRGDDIFDGGDGNDTLIGGRGADVLTGGADADTFVFIGAADSPNQAGRFDLITDFEHGIDRIDLSRLDGNVNVAGQQHLTFVPDGAIIIGVDQIGMSYNASTDTTLVTAVDGGSTNFHLEVHGHATQSDFIL